MSKIKSETLWAGTEAAWHDYVEASLNAGAYTYTEEEPPEIPELLEIQGNVGVVTIKGPLTNRDSRMNAYRGITSYNAIREAMIYAAQDESVQQILLEIDSGGGSVSGVMDTGNLIRMVNDKMKPVTAFTDGAMASAAYWLGSSAGKVYASKTALVGSIGVIATHMEESKALKEAGIGVTVMRSGKYKALANSVEPLTEGGRAQIQEMLDASYKVFVQHVAEARNVSYDLADSQMAQGREFMGETAVAAGLIDGIESYDALFNRLSKEFIDTSVNLIDNPKKIFQQEFGMGKKALSVTEVAALAEGGLALEAGEVTAPVVEAADDAEATLPLTKNADDTFSVGAAVTPVADEAKIDVQASSITEFLQAQIKEKDAAILSASIELAALKKQVQDTQAAQADLIAIVGKSLSNMRIALDMGAVDTAALSPEQVLAEHKRVAPLFAAQFKAGGVAAVDAAQSKTKEPQVDAMTRARLNAVRTSK